jgi:hypothetical protein
MSTNEYLFPQRFTRRDFLKLSSAAAAGMALPPLASAAEKQTPVRLGSGHHTYELAEGWGQLPAGMKYGLGCGIIVDSKDRVYVTSRSTNPCVAIFDRDGKLLETWSQDFGERVGLTTGQVADTAHCLYWSQERDGEFIYWTENISTNKEGPKFGARVYKTDLRGKILYTIGKVEKEGSTVQKFDWTNPTDVAVAPNGDIYVVDGYGSQRVSRFDQNFKHLRTIGGRSPKPGTGADHGTFNTCHGIWIKVLRGREPEVYIADRHNDRLEVFDLELNYKRTLAGDFVRNPCCFYQHHDQLFIPDLASRVTILNADDSVTAQLGDGRELAKEDLDRLKKEDVPQFANRFALPHALCVDSRGDFYVLEWVPYGRVRKFRHAPQV